MRAAEVLQDNWSVVRDADDRYSVWPNDKTMPIGWTKEPISGTRDECLQKIKDIWVDPRPRSLRGTMA